MTDLTFASFGLAQPITNALARTGFDTPTPIQAQAIGPQLEGRDILGLAQTGTGKTAAFALPILHHLLGLQGRPTPGTARALVLAPTRELAVQIQDEFRRFAGGARISTCLVLGGTSRGGQVRQLSRGVDVLIATPGRLLDLVDDRKVRLDEVRWVVLDEADRMLDMGFVKPVKRIVSMLHPRRQSALFSATMPEEVSGLAHSFLKDPVRVEVAPQSTVVTKIEQSAELLEGPKKRARLAQIVSGEGVERAIVFARTKRGADRVAQNLVKDGIGADAIHGNKAQNARQKALNNFKHGTIRVLVATDIAARGIDVKGISHVVNFDLPDEPENYVHRIGRTGRNGADGIAISLVAPDEVKKLRAVERITGEKLLPGSVQGEESRKPQRNRRGNGPANPNAKRRPNRRRRNAGGRNKPGSASSAA
ncbi:DEAD/DEAH box helicase [Pontivivens insulae]|uniref:ATP-dependent RNA helicase RhlE n=1 Tax=Pontivivens insulae TaxID=1639689 RepID=A0A2R8AC08_9RHOB|nr:DEAD/DEAH box helicase [Pontivivens insulae]RED11073.1 ATP-dependent RNA helicase RhlE [Pontivivens insulae]SPF29752.1 ATP-dependent RNA helicase RhlE [Pontivivens insulae]